jgi:hypothetical protein
MWLSEYRILMTKPAATLPVLAFKQITQKEENYKNLTSCFARLLKLNTRNYTAINIRGKYNC